MNENPYQSPLAPLDQPAIGVLSGRREDLRDVAKYQKGILICILIYLLAVICQLVLPPEVRLFLALGIFALGITATVFVFLLSIKVYGTGFGILLGILTLIPCIGLIVLLIINVKATSVLKKNGIKVGLLGADLSTI